MASEKMRLEAEMRDNASPAIKKLRGELAALQDQTREVRAVGQLNNQIETLRKEAAAVQVTPGMKAMPAWLGSATTAAEGFVKSGGGAAGVINSLGIGGLTAAASLGALVAHFREVGEGALGMKEFARQTGVSTDYLNAFEHAGQSFGLRADTMRKAIEGLADQMPQLKAGFGPLHDFLTGNGWGDLAKKLKTEDTSHALDDILNQLDKIKDPALQKQVLGDILKAPDLEAIYQRGGFKGFVEEMRRQSAKLPHIGEDAFKQAQAFRDSLISFNDALDRFDTKVGPKFLGALSTILDKLTNFFAADHPAIEKMQRAGGAKDEAEREKKNGLDLDDPRVKEALRKKSSYSGSAGLLHNAAFGLPERGAGMTGGIEATIANGTKAGFLAAFRELMSLGSAEAAGGNSPILASWGGGGGGRGGGIGRGGGGNFGLDPGTGSFPAGSSLEQVRQYIRAKASALGIDPNIAERVARSEGLNSTLGAGGDGGTSDGPFQLHVGGGLGDAYERQFHHSIHDKRYWKDQVDFALGQARSGGWSPWHGWRGPAFAGIGIKPDSSALDALNKGGGDIGMNLHTLNEQCVSLARAAVGASGTVHEWRKGIGAIEGTLKPGTPIATFLDRHGRASDRYAGGGNGTPGAHLDHAGVFQGYIRDKDGKIIGMHMAEQYAGSHGVHSKAYAFGSGWGEGNGSNYSAIMGPDGRPLGGDRNPMSRRATGLADDSPLAAAARAHVHLQIDHHPESRVRVVKPSRDVTTIMRSRWPSGSGDMEA